MSSFIPWRTVDLQLQATRSIWISTTRPDGRPHAVPVWYVWDGANVDFITRCDLQQARNLAHQRWVAVHAGDGDDAIIREGPVEIVPDEEEHREERMRADTMYAERYVGPRTGARDTIFHEETDLYRVRVQHVMAWDYGVVATRTDWRFDA
jgi:nitroimidazol reductase NimA-like FMN-containing flavoprotein (pyridoxamine 5'-phosphate oxidase superfamily)